MVKPLTPDEVLELLAKPIAQTRAALDDGVSFADSTLDGQPRCAHTWAALVRYRARNHLVEKCQPDDTWKVRKLRNSGFAVSMLPFSMRTLKAQQAGPPSPGRNYARQDYWRQTQQMAFSLPGDGIDPKHAANLILDWTLGNDHQVLVALSKPIGTWRYKGPPVIEWRRAISFDGSNNPVWTPGDEDVLVKPKYDLDELGADAADQE